MGQESKFAKGHDGPLLFTPRKSRTLRKKEMAGLEWAKLKIGYCCLTPLKEWK